MRVYNNASNPFLSSISSNLHEGPPGFFVPASQARTVAVLVLMMMANAAWLTFRRERRAFTLSALNWGTCLSLERAPNSRIRRSSIIPPVRKPCTALCVSSIIRLDFAMIHLQKISLTMGDCKSSAGIVKENLGNSLQIGKLCLSNISVVFLKAKQKNPTIVPIRGNKCSVLPFSPRVRARPVFCRCCRPSRHRQALALSRQSP